MQPQDAQQSPAANVAFEFATALVTGDFAAAHRMLVPELRGDLQPADLRSEYAQMTGYWQQPADTVELLSFEDNWAFVSIASIPPDRGACLEGVALRIANESDVFQIGEIVWGRP